MKRDFLSIADWTSENLWRLLDLSAKIKKHPADFSNSLHGKSVAMIFEKQSLRTHVTFDVGINQLGGHSIFLSQAGISLGKRESIYDVAKNLERWVNAVVIRTYAHATCVEMAKAMEIPVINALTDLEHPCQAVGDFLTIIENFGSLKKRTLCFVGDGNNVCHSLMLMAGKLGMDFVAVTPKGYEPSKRIVKLAIGEAKKSGSSITVHSDIRKGTQSADVIYTDVWASMGQETEQEKRRKIFRKYQVNGKIIKMANKSAIFMHCLPAHRGEEVADSVMDSRQSRIFVQAENRLHTQKAILHTLFH